MSNTTSRGEFDRWITNYRYNKPISLIDAAPLSCYMICEFTNM